MSTLSSSLSTRRFLLVFLLSISLFPAKSQGYYNREITLSPATLTLREALGQLEEKGGIRFVYSRLDDLLEQPVSFAPATATVSDLLGQLENKVPVSLHIQGENVAVKPVQTGNLRGTVTDDEGAPVVSANVQLLPLRRSVVTDASGAFFFDDIPYGTYQVQVSYLGMEPIEENVTVNAGTPDLDITLPASHLYLSQVEVFGERNSQPDKLDAITRLPLKPADQIQSISIISEKVIRRQGNLNVRDAVQNVPGVYTFATYGNTKESLAARGFRGLPTLKNGVRVYEDGLGQGFITDMEGVESIQVLKGSNAITQGLSADIGNSGGVVNVVTKTPKFENSGYVSLRGGSWGLFRPAFDVQGVANKAGTLGVRMNGAFERRDSYRQGISGQKIYLNPSMSWKVDDKTTLTLEMDYLNDGRTPDAGTVNLAGIDSNAIYDLPHEQFLGFENDRFQTKNLTYAARIKRQFNDHLHMQVALYGSRLRTNNQGVLLSGLAEGPANLRGRSIIGSTVANNNSVLQIDLVGQELYTGAIKHTFQIGLDYKTAYIGSWLPSNNVQGIDTIDVFAPIGHQLPAGTRFIWDQAPAVDVHNAAYGFLAQDVISFNRYAELVLGLRYSASESETNSSYGATRADAWNPQAGIIITPMEGFRVFGSYTSNTGINAATIIDRDGNHLEQSRYDQFEAGLKTEWLNNRLRFNLTLYKIYNQNLPMRVYEGNVATPFYEKGGNDERKGIEVELTGRPLQQLDIIAGYAYIDARYKDHTSFYYDSQPLNTPKHTYNVYANYTVDAGVLKGLSLGAGIYYIGERPVNDWSRVVDEMHGIQPGLKPFMIDAVTTINAQLAYSFNEHWDLRLLGNNLFDNIGYNAYRTMYINQTDPRNFSVVASYNF